MKIHLPVLGPDLPVHPRTGLTALGLRRNGAPIWPVRGGSGEGEPPVGAPPANPANPAGEGGDDDLPPDLGDAGKQAIDRMKAQRNAALASAKALEEQLAKLAPLQKLAEALAGSPSGDGKTDLETLTARLTQHETELAKERAARTRAEVIAEKQLSPKQAKRLQGSTREELAADADEILRDFPDTPASSRPGSPRPDRSQGNRGDKPLSGREAAMAEAQRRFGKTPAAT